MCFHVCVPARMGLLVGLGLGVGLWVSLGMGQPLGLPEACQGKPQTRWSSVFLEALNVEGSLAMRRKPRSAAGVLGGWLGPPTWGKGWSCRAQSWDAAACGGRQLEDEQPL